MDNEIIFRLITLLLLAGFVAHRGYYTRKLGDAAEEAASEREKPGVLKAANLLFPLALITTALYLIHPPWMDWASLSLPAWLRWVGVGLALLGFVTLQWSQNTLGKNWSDTPRLMEDQVLVTDGPYRWVRHPIYSAFLLIMGSTLFITANWLIGLTWIGATLGEVMWRANIEEGMMIERFGEQYRAYMGETGRFVPRLLR
jgi:protein-S-isoprenylcysteine O-methyltransferase Ste14